MKVESEKREERASSHATRALIRDIRAERKGAVEGQERTIAMGKQAQEQLEMMRTLRGE
jgi:hypothetical protein